MKKTLTILTIAALVLGLVGVTFYYSYRLNRLEKQVKKRNSKPTVISPQKTFNPETPIQTYSEPTAPLSEPTAPLPRSYGHNDGYDWQQEQQIRKLEQRQKELEEQSHKYPYTDESGVTWERDDRFWYPD